jgi:hypothetical protein
VCWAPCRLARSSLEGTRRDLALPGPTAASGVRYTLILSFLTAIARPFQFDTISPCR